MKKRSKILLSAILTIALCLSLIAGSTFALFTSESKVNIAVTSGKVKVTATLVKDSLELYSATTDSKDAEEHPYEEAGTVTGTNYDATYYYEPVSPNFTNGGTAVLSGDTLTLTNVTPGDKVKLNINIKNDSNVNIKYRTRIDVTGETDTKLFEALEISINGDTQNKKTTISDWETWLPTATSEKLVPVTIALPINAGNEYQEKSIKLTFAVEAVQGNAAWALLDRINTKLANEAVANTNMSDALADIANIANESVIKANNFVWNSETDRFTTESAATTNQVKYFKIYDEMPETQTYSIYASSSWAEDTVNVTVGFDAGTKTNITAITYDRQTATVAQTVIIRTNGGTLTVNAPLDTVKHYGNADKVDVQAVANASYHENGTVQLIAVKQGHVKLEGEAEANGIYVYNESTTEQKDTSFAEIKITVDNGVDIPKFSRSAVEVQPEGTKVCTIVTDQAKDIYLFNEGIYEQIKTVDAGKNVASDVSATWADNSTKNTANTQTAAQQLANEFNGSYDSDGYIADQEVVVTGDNAGTYTVKFNQETREFETYQGDTKVAEATVVEAVAEVADVASESGKTAAQAAQAAMFKGEGTESSPYEINNGNDWYNLLTKYQGLYMGSSTNGLYVILKGDIDMTGYDISSYNSYPRNFHLDGNGFTMKNFETSIWGDDGTLYLTNTFTNLKLDNCHSSNNSLFGGTQNSNTASVTFNNVDLNNCSAVGGAYQYYDGSATATFIDCDVTNTNVLGGYMASGGFIGNISTGIVVIDHCSFGGSVVSTQSACGGFVGQSANYDPNKITIKDSTIIAGTVIRNVAGGNVAAFNAHTGTQDYAQFNNSFYGTLETTGTKYKQGTNAAEKTYEPICTAADFTLNSVEGTLTYNGSAGLGKIAVQVYVIDDYIYNGEYYGGYNYYVCDPIKANNIVNGTTISGIPVITDFYNVVSSTSTPVGLQTTDTTYIDEIHNGVFYFDAQTYSWGHYMLGGTYKDGSAVEPTSLNVYIKITVYDNSDALIGVVSGATLKYTVDLSNHSN